MALFTLFLCLYGLSVVTATEFVVGDKYGWTVPNKSIESYNDWASHHRFNLQDTLRFKYNKDAVMEVTKEEYKKCRSSHPFYYSNDGDTVVKLERPGLFYFISGVGGHCERGLKMIVKVLDLHQTHNQTAPPSPSNPDHGDDDAPRSAAVSTASHFVFSAVFLFLALF